MLATVAGLGIIGALRHPAASGHPLRGSDV